MGLSEYVVPLPLDSSNAMHVLRHLNLRPQVIHIDGAHDETSVSLDLQAWWPLLETGGVLIGDDYRIDGAWPGVRQAFDKFAERFELGTIEQTYGKCRLHKK